jgi:DNA-binding transcriptional LysR family regulator
MDKLKAIQLFLRLAELGSISRVAEEQQLAKSMVSTQLKKLEQQLGVRLFQRTTRHFSLTAQGEQYRTQVQTLLGQMETLEDQLRTGQTQLSGKLKISASMAMGVTFLGRAIAAFQQQYPQVELDVQLGDEAVDLVQQGFDLALRASSQPLDSLYVGRQIGRFRYYLCASPAYLGQQAAIHQLSDLQKHNCFEYSYFRSRNFWPIGDGVRIDGKVRANSTPFLKELVLAGLGLALLPEFVAVPEINNGQLEEVLADLPRPSLDLYALYPVRHHVPLKVDVFIRFMQTWLAENASNQWQ